MKKIPYMEYLMSNLGRKTLSDLVVPLKFGISILKKPLLQIFTLSAGSEHLFHISAPLLDRINPKKFSPLKFCVIW